MKPGFNSATSGAAQFRPYWGGTAQGHKEGHKTKRQALNARLALTPIGLRQLAPRVPAQCERRFAGLLQSFVLPREVPRPRYTKDQAQRLAKETGQYGPWDKYAPRLQPAQLALRDFAPTKYRSASAASSSLPNDKVGARQRYTAKGFHSAGLLGAAGLKALESRRH